MNNEVTDNAENEIIKKSSSKTSKTREQKLEARKLHERIPLYKQGKIGVGIDVDNKKYHTRLVHDVGDRLSSFKKAGYEDIFNENNGMTVSSQDPAQMGTKATLSVGGGITGHYMRIPIKLYNADQLEKQKRWDITMNNIRNYGMVDKTQAFKSDLTVGSVDISSSYEEE
jgi:hypothetical protein